MAEYRDGVEVTLAPVLLGIAQQARDQLHNLLGASELLLLENRIENLYLQTIVGEKLTEHDIEE